MSQLAGMIPYGIGRGFDRSRTNGWYIRVRGKKEYFASEELRDGEYDRRIAEAKFYGEKAAATVTPGDRQLLQEVRRLTAPTGYTPLEIFERGLTLVGRRPRATMSVEKAVKQLLAVSKGRQREGLIRPRRLKELRNVLTRFSTAFANRELQTIGREDVNDFLMGLGVGPQTRINNARVISRLFSWAKDEIGCVVDNPVVITERVRRVPAVFAVGQAANLLEKAKQDYPEIIPMLVLQWFAGIRPTATQQMRWPDINREARTITIRAEISKLGEPEVIEHLPDELWAWIDGQRKPKGRIAPANHIKLAQRLHQDLGFTGRKKWPTDVARHTFASHLYPRLRSIDAVAKILCHRGSRVTLKHYVAKNVTEAESQAYFALIGSLLR